MHHVDLPSTDDSRWNRAKVVGQKVSFKPREIWATPIRLQLAGRSRDLALFNLAIDSKLRACDHVANRLAAFLAASCLRLAGGRPFPENPWVYDSCWAR